MPSVAISSPSLVRRESRSAEPPAGETGGLLNGEIDMVITVPFAQSVWINRTSETAQALSGQCSERRLRTSARAARRRGASSPGVRGGALESRSAETIRPCALRASSRERTAGRLAR
jgi:hypothetical protein